MFINSKHLILAAFILSKSFVSQAFYCEQPMSYCNEKAKTTYHLGKLLKKENNYYIFSKCEIINCVSISYSCVPKSYKKESCDQEIIISKEQLKNLKEIED